MVRSICVVLGLAVGTCLLGGCSGGGGSSNHAVIEFLLSNFQVNEDGTPITQITLTRTSDFGGTVSVTVSVTDGSATNPADYIVTGSIVVVWNDGDGADKIVTVGPVASGADIEIVDDHIDEGTPGPGGSETVNLTLTSPTGGAQIGGLGSATLEILDIDNAGRIEFTLSNYFYNEAGMSGFEVMVQRIGGSDGLVTATIVATDGTANSDPNSLIEPVDYGFSSVTVSFDDTIAGTLTIALLPGIVQDLLPELDENFTLSIVSTTGNLTIGGQSSTSVTIFDDDVMLEIPNPNTETNALYGKSVAKVGQRLAVGAPNSNTPTGRVHFFDPAFGSLTNTFGQPFAQQFGTRLIVDGFTFAVGSTGQVYVFDSDGFSTSLRYFRSSSQGGFGTSGLGLQDGRLAIGAPLAQLGGSTLPSGQVFIYDADFGSLLQTIDGVADNEFGTSFARLGSDLYIGSPGNTGTTQAYLGSPLVLDFVIANPAPNALPSPAFGEAVASLGGTAIVGAPDEDLLLPNEGLLYLFSGGPALPIIAPGPFVANGRFGAEILVMANRICVQQQGGGPSGTGRVFVLDSSGTPVSVIDDPAPSPGADFGASMCEFDGVIVIGAPKHGFLLEPGSVFIFHLP